MLAGWTATMTYANQLTILRMIFIPCFVLLLIYGYPKVAVLVFVLAGITDGLDGLLARKLQQKTVLGSFLDPMADKLLITSAFVTLTIPTVPISMHIPVWLTVTAISRDLLIAMAVLIIHLQTGHATFPPTFLGKLTTTAQLVTVATTLVSEFSVALGQVLFMPIVIVALLLTIVSGLHYFYVSVRIIEAYQSPGVAGDDKRVENR